MVEGLEKESFPGRPLHFVIHFAYKPRWPENIDWHNVILSSVLDKIFTEIKHTVYI